MSNQMAEITNLAKGLQQSAQQASSGGDGSFMKFTKFGEWLWGTESTEVEEDALWAIHPQGFQHGWIAWGDKKHNNNGTKLGETMVPATDPLPPQNTLPEVQGSWAQQISIQMICLSGIDKGTKVLFNSCSTGGRKAYNTIVNAVVAEITAGSQKVAPSVTLDSDHYTHKEFGKIFTPVMRVEEWNTLDDLKAALSEAEADAGGAAEVDTAAALAKVDDAEEEVVVGEAEELPEEEAAKKPARRRRRS